LRGVLGYLFDHGMLPDSPFASPGVRNGTSILVQELMAELIDRLDDGGQRKSLATAQETRPVRSAEDFMRAHLEQPLSVGELATQLSVSRRRLQYALQHVRQASPRTILGELRLERARQKLADPAEGRTVAQIALDCGLAHFGHFAAAYAARYGELPSDTLRRGQRR
jgi:transcriptional regulator GlxA family with amidase domain